MAFWDNLDEDQTQQLLMGLGARLLASGADGDKTIKGLAGGLMGSLQDYSTLSKQGAADEAAERLRRKDKASAEEQVREAEFRQDVAGGVLNRRQLLDKYPKLAASYFTATKPDSRGTGPGTAAGAKIAKERRDARAARKVIDEVVQDPLRGPEWLRANLPANPYLSRSLTQASTSLGSNDNKQADYMRYAIAPGKEPPAAPPPEKDGPGIGAWIMDLMSAGSGQRSPQPAQAPTPQPQGIGQPPVTPVQQPATRGGRPVTNRQQAPAGLGAITNRISGALDAMKPAQQIPGGRGRGLGVPQQQAPMLAPVDGTTTPQQRAEQERKRRELMLLQNNLLR